MILHDTGSLAVGIVGDAEVGELVLLVVAGGGWRVEPVSIRPLEDAGRVIIISSFQSTVFAFLDNNPLCLPRQW
jgi:hypothetical protein